MKTNFGHECYQNVYLSFFHTTHGQLSGNMSQVSGMISFRIVTAHNFFVLHNNHPFNHNLGAKHCSSAERKRDTLFSPVSTVVGCSFCTVVNE